MKINLQPYGFKQLNSALEKANEELRKALGELLKKIAKTAEKKAIETAPSLSGNYKTTIKGVLLNKFRARLQSERKKITAEDGTSKASHGFLAGLLEYGTKKMEARPHLEKAVEYALEFHKAEVEAYFKGSFLKGLSGYTG